MVVVVAEHLYDAQKLVDQIDQVTSYHARLVVPGYGQRGGRPVL